jgi:NDP-sugar pyrophosphorylase family protein
MEALPRDVALGPPQIAASADIDPRSTIGDGSVVWHLAQVREYARVGNGSIIGRGAYIGPGVILGHNCKVQNYALVYEPALLEDGVFVGPSVVFTNDVFPRATNLDGTRKTGDDSRRGGSGGDEGCSRLRTCCRNAGTAYRLGWPERNSAARRWRGPLELPHQR